MYRLPKFTPTLVGGQPSEPHGETTMDLEVAHAIAPDAVKVVINARPTVAGDGAFEKIAQMFDSADRQFPGAVWSFSIGWGCDKLHTAADLAPVRFGPEDRAVARHIGVQCQRRPRRAGMQGWPGLVVTTGPCGRRAGFGRVASRDDRCRRHPRCLPMRMVVWLAEQTWFDVPLSQGTGGGVSSLFDPSRLAAGRRARAGSEPTG